MSLNFTRNLKDMNKKIMLLGSGELGKEFVIALKRLGQYVVAVDNYDNAPAMQVADEREVINMLDGEALDALVAKHKPDIIVPEIEAIRTERFYDYEKQNIQVVPSARAANFTMDRQAIRDLTSRELGLKTAKYSYASNYDDFIEAVKEIGMPCVVKPLMSSSGKGQSTIKSETDIDVAWHSATTKGRGDKQTVIVEQFIKFDTEITLLTVTQKDGETLFCPPIGHRQERGDYQESWQPALVTQAHLKEMQHMAEEVTKSLTGFGIWGVEFFLADDGVYFSELSPRPHDTGMVTLAGSQNYSEFELHARAVLGLPIPQIKLEKAAASAVILAMHEGTTSPTYTGLIEAAAFPDTDVKIFGKPTTRMYRRMGVALAYGKPDADINLLRKKAKEVADCVEVG
ncbi:MAG: formate-dependent phosphoribosylglycinamide formyltransferase [Bacteroidetes bacterium]|nr:formate-dependent phosphoribosylglycinamide formyltransferase [Bacteroidota bacterium]